ncbi:MAG: DEAD/DEAH box helicase, partial [Planctomycetota bacterium]
MLDRLGGRNRKATPNRPRALVLAPTRELAVQIGESFAAYGRHLRLRQSVVYGGVGQARQVRTLNRGAHLLVATPGRLLDLMGQKHIILEDLEVFVLDEADRMLDMGFLPDLKRIIGQLPQNRQSLFFSATLPRQITALAATLLSDPVNVNVTPRRAAVGRIDQRMLFVEQGGKQALLKKILSAHDVDRALVFTRTKRGANTLAARLLRGGIKAAAIHGNKSQNARQRALDAFRRKQVDVLVATDVAARGIDIDGISHVVNFDLPDEPESYVHRIGRTGRAGADGVALSFCSADQRSELRAIEKLIGQPVPFEGSAPQWKESESNSRNGRSARSTARRPSGSTASSKGGGKGQRSQARREGGKSAVAVGSKRKRRPR